MAEKKHVRPTNNTETLPALSPNLFDHLRQHNLERKIQYVSHTIKIRVMSNISPVLQLIFISYASLVLCIQHTYNGSKISYRFVKECPSPQDLHPS